MKTVSRIFLTLAMVMFFAGMGMSQVASTATPEKKTTKSAVNAPGKFVDANKNGICDKHETKGACTQQNSCKGKNGQGACDHSGKNCKDKGNGCGSGNGNGNCCSKGQQGKGCESSCGNGPQHRNGCSTQTSTPAPQPNK